MKSPAFFLLLELIITVTSANSNPDTAVTLSDILTTFGGCEQNLIVDPDFPWHLDLHSDPIPSLLQAKLTPVRLFTDLQIFAYAMEHAEPIARTYSLRYPCLANFAILAEAPPT